MASIGFVLTYLSALFEGTTTYPSLDLTISNCMQIHDVANDYSNPIVNNSLEYTPTSGITNIILDDWNLFNETFTNSMSDQFGKLKYFDISSNTLAHNGTAFETDLLESTDVRYYTGFYIPSIFENNTILLGSNVSAYHSYPIVFNEYYNWILKSEFDSSASIAINSHPLPLTQNEKSSESNVGSDIFSGVIPAVYLLMGLTYIAQIIMSHVVMDKEKQTKSQQFVSGVSFISYWLGNYIWDIFTGIPAALFVTLLIPIFGVDAYMNNGVIGLFVLLVFLYLLSVTAFTYLLSHMFEKQTTARIFAAATFNILALILIALDFILGFISSTQDVNSNILEPIYRIFPFYLFGNSIFLIGLLNGDDSSSDFNGNSYNSKDINFWDWDLCGRNITYMIVEAFGYLMLVMVIEYILQNKGYLAYKFGKHDQNIDMQEVNTNQRRGSKERALLDDAHENDRKKKKNIGNNNHNNMDDDVLGEQDRIERLVENNELNQDIVMIAGLGKVYKTPRKQADKVAVKHMYYGVKKGEIFGFLGVNGAGKTTTLQMLTGENTITNGDAFINGYSVISNQNQVRRFIGYCPQHDRLFDLLTAREHLYFYGSLKNLKGDELESQINLLLKKLNLVEYENKLSKTLSGGNKRKLSVGIAMIGNPPVNIFDEPSAGVDPLSRRQMQEFIANTKGGKSTILTSHNMIECEKLASRIAIMVNGELKCIGTGQHLKSKFGSGFQLDLLLNTNYKENNTKEKIEMKLNEFGFDCKCIDLNNRRITYQIEKKLGFNFENDDDVNRNGMSKESIDIVGYQGCKLKLSQLFDILERLKNEMNNVIMSYAVSQPTLEQIFLQMARHQELNDIDNQATGDEKTV